MAPADRAPSAAYRVPASTTNLGPGFDCLGIALKLYNHFEAELASQWSFEAHGEGADEIGKQERNLVIEAMQQVFEEAFCGDLAARVVSENAVPLANGLGSSSTALVGGMLLARDVLRQLPGEVDSARIPDDARLFQMLTEAEGHPDNVAPTWKGGFTICWTDEAREVRGHVPAHCYASQPSAGVAAVIVSSHRELHTSEARRVLPERISRADAISNLSRTALLVAAILDGRPDLLRAAMKDRLHEPYRAPLIPDFETLRAALLEAGADGAGLSGAGPTVAALVIDADDEAALVRALDIANSFNERSSLSFPDRFPARAVGIAREGALKVG
ncbi:MAG: homoserine kinase [Coriobacteriia bacterium]|nr:homoserine kinase [Coriobacteriia bacterium]